MDQLRVGTRCSRAGGSSHASPNSDPELSKPDPVSRIGASCMRIRTSPGRLGHGAVADDEYAGRITELLVNAAAHFGLRQLPSVPFPTKPVVHPLTPSFKQT